MTQRADLDRAMAAYLEGRATSRAPSEVLEAAMERIESTRQRPGWLVLDRWLSARRQGGVAQAAKAAVVLGTLALLLGLVIVIGVFVGSRQPLPPPFGLARPGLIAFDLSGDIYVAKPDGTGRARLTSGPDNDAHPTFSPDGTRIAYETEVADLSTSLVVMDPDGRHRAVLADHLAEVGDLAWSPDSRVVSYGSRIVGDSAFHVFVARVDQPGAVRLGPPDLVGIEPSWSPYGTRIAFKHLDPCCGIATLWLMGADGSHPHELAAEPKALSDNWDNALWNTAWSPDGTRIAFLAAGDGGAYDVYVVGADGRGLVDVSNSPEDESWPTWSPDGTRIAYPWISRDANNAATYVVVEPDGAHPVPLTGAFVTRGAPVWSPDATRLIGSAYNVGLGSSDALVVFDATGRTAPIVLPEPALSGESWQRPLSAVSWQRLAP